MIYLIDFGTCLKIGITKDIKKRVQSFRTSRENVDVLDLIVNPKVEIDNNFDRENEMKLHSLCKQFNITGELFQKCDDVINIFKELKNELGDFVDWVSNIKFDQLDSISKLQEIYKYSLDGKLIVKYNSIKETLEKENVKSSNGLYRALLGERNKFHNAIWSKIPLTDDILKEKIIKASKNCWYEYIIQYDKENNELNKFKTLSEASEKTGIAMSGISNCISGKYKTSGGFIWKAKKADVD